MTTISHTPASIGTLALPTSGKVILDDNNVHWPNFNLTFKLDKARIPVTDAGAGGSFGSLKLFDFIAGPLIVNASDQRYKSFVEGAALTGNAGDAAFKIGLGTVAVAAAADNALTGTSVDLGTAVSVTLVAGAGEGTAQLAAGKVIDGAVTPADLHLNFSGSAATIDANSYIDVTGYVAVSGTFLSER